MVPVSYSPAKLRLVDVGLSKRQTLRGFWLYILDGHQETSVDLRPRHHRIIARGSSWQPRGCNPWVAHQQATTHHVLKPPKRSPFETMWLALAPVPGERKHWNKVTKCYKSSLSCRRKKTNPRDTICQEWTCNANMSNRVQKHKYYHTTKLNDLTRNINILHTKVAPQLCTRQKVHVGQSKDPTHQNNATAETRERAGKEEMFVHYGWTQRRDKQSN